MIAALVSLLRRSTPCTPRVCSGCGSVTTRLTPAQSAQAGSKILPTCRRRGCTGRLRLLTDDATDRLINDLNKTAAPGWNPGAAEPNDCLESKDMTRSIPRHAREIHAGDIITRDPDHENRPVRWRASNRAEVTGDGVAIIDYVDQADGVKGIAYYGGLVTLTVEPAGGAQ